MSLLVFTCALAIAVDGDTLRCANIEQAGGRVRIARIGAPDRGEPGYAEAKAAMAALIADRPVRCRQVDADPRTPKVEVLDPFGRIVAFCDAGGAQLGEAMIALKHAEVWPRRP